MVVALVGLTGCGGGSSPSAPSSAVVTTLVDTSVTLPVGATCQTSGQSLDFSSESGKTIAITVTGSAGTNLVIILYAPDFATQLATGGLNGTTGTLSFTLFETGTHHLTVCDANGVGGAVRVNVTTRPDAAKGLDRPLVSVAWTFPAGQTCQSSGRSVDFRGQGGQAIQITATGVSGMSLGVILYAPDFATQLASATSGSTTTLTFTLTQTGTHHVSVCDGNGIGGTVRLTVVVP